MKILMILILFSFSFLQAEKIKDKEYDIGLLIEKHNFREMKDIRLGLKRIFTKAQEIKKEVLNISFYQNSDEIINDFVYEKKLDIINVMPIDYLNNRDLIYKHSDSFWIIKDSKNNYKQYYIISNVESGINDISDIENKKIVTYLSDNLARIWLDKLSLEINRKSYTTLIGKEITTKSSSKPILDIFFKKSDIAVVTKLSWEVMKELNPGIMKKIKIIKKSEPIFFLTLGFFHKDSSKSLRKKFKKAIVDPVFEDNLEELLALVKSKEFMFVDDSYFTPIHKFYDEYLELKNKARQ